MWARTPRLLSSPPLRDASESSSFSPSRACPPPRGGIGRAQPPVKPPLSVALPSDTSPSERRKTYVRSLTRLCPTTITTKEVLVHAQAINAMQASRTQGTLDLFGPSPPSTCLHSHFPSASPRRWAAACRVRVRDSKSGENDSYG